MKKSIIIPLFFIGALFSCKEKSISPLSKDSSKTDTLVFYTENEIIDLGEEGEFLAYSAMSDDASAYYIFNLEKRILYNLDLKTRKLLSTLKMPSEGPDGIGDWLIDFQRLDDQNFIAQGDNAFYFFNLKGKLMDKIRVDHLFYLYPSDKLHLDALCFMS